LFMTITALIARQILDSRSNPTIEVDAYLSDGSMGRAAVPSGASTGEHEAVELRDGDQKHFHGKGVLRAAEFVNTEIASFLRNNDPTNQFVIDQEMVLRDGTPNSARFGANALLGVSLAVSKAVAASRRMPYHQYVAELYRTIALAMTEPGGTMHLQHTLTLNSEHTRSNIPCPMFNVLNGGAHTNWQSTDCQEFMVVPHGAGTFAEGCA
jgi:enolase